MNLTSCQDFIKILSEVPEDFIVCVLDEQKNVRCDNIVIKEYLPIHIISIQPDIQEGCKYTVKEMVEMLQEKQQDHIIQMFDKERGVLCLQNIKYEKKMCDIVVYSSNNRCKKPTCTGYCIKEMFC